MTNEIHEEFIKNRGVVSFFTHTFVKPESYERVLSHKVKLDTAESFESQKKDKENANFRFLELGRVNHEDVYFQFFSSS